MSGGRSTPEEVVVALRRAADQCDYITSHGRDAFLADDPHGRLLRDGGERLIITIQAALDDLPAEFVHAHADLPFTLMRGMRNRLAHGYEDISATIVWRTLDRRLPAFVREVTRRLDE